MTRAFSSGLEALNKLEALQKIMQFSLASGSMVVQTAMRTMTRSTMFLEAWSLWLRLSARVAVLSEKLCLICPNSPFRLEVWASAHILVGL